MNIVFFDDHNWFNLHPLTLTRPSADLRVGIQTIAEKWTTAMEVENFSFKTEPYLQDLYSEQSNENSVFINGRCLPNAELVEAILALKSGDVLSYQDVKIAGKGSETVTSTDYTGHIELIDNPWDIFLKNQDQINFDIQQKGYTSAKDLRVEFPNVFVEDYSNLYIGRNVVIEAGTYILNADGPVYFGDDVTVMAGSYIRGGNAVCEHSVIKMGAKLYSGNTIGPHCKVGGEVQNTVFHSFSNKGHDGYIGNSVIGSWCNLGAGTDTSNLKNNYSKISWNRFCDGEKVSTGQQFIGTILGDHSKLAIGSKMNTATQCGIFANVFSSSFPSKVISSFSWLGDNIDEMFDLEKSFEMAENMMSRRDVPLTLEYKEMMKYLHANSR